MNFPILQYTEAIEQCLPEAFRRFLQHSAPDPRDAT